MVLVIQEYELYLCDQILYELNDVVKRKAPNALSALSILIDDLDFINVPEVDLGSVSISDTNKMIIFVFRWKLTLPTFTNALNGFVQGWLGT